VAILTEAGAVQRYVLVRDEFHAPMYPQQLKNATNAMNFFTLITIFLSSRGVTIFLRTEAREVSSL
jgi:hypothetical protein